MPLEALLRRDRALVVAGLAGITALAWIYLLREASTMSAMMEVGMDMAMPQMHTWSAVDLLLLSLMWAIMMVAMMLPSAAPMILTFTTINRKRTEQRAAPLFPMGAFVLGYVVVWSAYSAVAALVQWLLHENALLSPMMASTSGYLGGGLLIAAGVFQWTPLKRACLTACRSPLSFLMTRWRPGIAGALGMGIRHGAYCVGCCWILMTLLFVAGVMNLLWVATIAVFVLIEKVLPGGERIGRAAGVLMLLAGVALIAAGPTAPM